MALVAAGECPPVAAGGEELVEHNATPLEFVDGQKQGHTGMQRVAGGGNAVRLIALNFM